MSEPIDAPALAARVPQALWQEADGNGSPGPRVFTVLRFEEDRKGLVLGSDGSWAWTSIRPGGGLRVHRLEPPDVIGALPLLEVPIDRLASKVAEAATVLAIPPERLAESIPAKALISVAIGTRSDYWIDRALSWIEQGSWPVLPVESMRGVVEDRSVGQQLRHRMKRLIPTVAGE